MSHVCGSIRLLNLLVTKIVRQIALDVTSARLSKALLSLKGDEQLSLFRKVLCL